MKKLGEGEGTNRRFGGQNIKIPFLYMRGKLSVLM